MDHAERLRIPTYIREESSSTDPLNGEPLRLLEPAIRLFFTVCTTGRVVVMIEGACRVLQAVGQMTVAKNRLSCLYLGRVNDDDAGSSTPLWLECGRTLAQFLACNSELQDSLW